MSPEFKDLFSKQAGSYSRYRPTYPTELFRYLAGLPAARACAWDCGTGNGQAAVELAAYFDRVVATDPSSKQLASAAPHPKVEYRQAAAESSGLEGGSVDLITVAQAFHWFKHERFYEEARRVARKAGGSVLALWAYELCRVSEAIDRIVDHYYRDVIGSYWEPERRLVETGYRDVAVPFRELKAPRFVMRADWSGAHMLGYLGTWSATQAAARALGRDPLDTIRAELLSAWPESRVLGVEWELSVRVFAIE